MPLKELVERIRKDTARESAAIRAAAEKEAREIAEAARAREETLFQREIERKRTQFEFESRRKLSAKKSEQQREFLEEREVLLRGVRESLEDRLASLPTDEEKEMLEHLLRLASAVIPAGRIQLPARNRELLGDHALAAYEAAVDDTLVGGFILTDPAGERILDCTYAALAERFWVKQRIAIARALLGEAMQRKEASV
jgi:vacuolar-type H+-ATPase subunit E/Vma4